jgi:hypothetical protein
VNHGCWLNSFTHFAEFNPGEIRRLLIAFYWQIPALKVKHLVTCDNPHSESLSSRQQHWSTAYVEPPPRLVTPREGEVEITLVDGHNVTLYCEILNYVCTEEKMTVSRRSNELPRIPATSAQDCMELASQFRDLAKDPNLLAPDVWAEWTHFSSDGKVIAEEWSVRGGKAKEDCEILCMKAGAMLAYSPKVLSKASTSVQAETDHLERWLYYLKENNRVKKKRLDGQTMNREGKTTIFRESIQNLVSVSASICVACSAEET